jgi:hypothetical protein
MIDEQQKRRRGSSFTMPRFSFPIEEDIWTCFSTRGGEKREEGELKKKAEIFVLVGCSLAPCLLAVVCVCAFLFWAVTSVAKLGMIWVASGRQRVCAS